MNTKAHKSFAPGSIVSVLLPLPLGTAYDYRVPDGMRLATGDLVSVPFGPRRISGAVWGPGTSLVCQKKIKDVIALHICSPLPMTTRSFVDWVSRYTMQMPGAVLKMAISVPRALDPPKPIVTLALAKAPDELRMTPARQKILTTIANGLPLSATELTKKTGVSTGVIRGLIQSGAITKISEATKIISKAPDPDQPAPILSNQQITAANKLLNILDTGGFRVTVIDGVPGSGKTEVYFQAIAKVLKTGRQALVLLPEIALSAQWLERFKCRFGAEPIEWHSDLTAQKRNTNWRAVIDGQAKVVVGARSALFLPFPDLGLIVVDEEHESAYKQEDGVIYNGRDMAVVRAQIGEIPIALVSATPSLETVVNAEQGRYDRVHMGTRYADAAMPVISSIDLVKSPPEKGNWLSSPLREAISETLHQGEQALLFLNRRGYAPLTLCRCCGYRFQCPTCSAWLVEHRLIDRLQCHHCGYSMPPPTHCQSCEAENSLVACGPGVERLAEELKRSFPGARMTIAASDNINSPKRAAELVAEIEAHKVDLIIGTQIIAKGYHFPLLTLVGAVDADLGLQGGDLRAAERTYQLLYQVAGRAGREEKPGRVFLQTYMASHPVIQALTAGDREKFLFAEKDARRSMKMPPFGRLVSLIVSGKDETAVDEVSFRLGRTAPHSDEIQVLGPAPAPFALLRGRHRRRLLLKANRGFNVQASVRSWLDRTPYPKSVRVQIDIDPYSFF